MKILPAYALKSFSAIMCLFPDTFLGGLKWVSDDYWIIENVSSHKFMNLFVFPCFCLPKDRHHQTIKYGWKTFVCSAQITALLLSNAHWNDGMGSGVWGLRVFMNRVSALPELFEHLYSQDSSCTFRVWIFFNSDFSCIPFCSLIFSLFFHSPF